MQLTKYGGHLLKEKSFRNGSVGLIKLTESLLVVVALDKTGEQLFSRSFPFTEETQKSVSRQSREYFKIIEGFLFRGVALDDLEI